MNMRTYDKGRFFRAFRFFPFLIFYYNSHKIGGIKVEVQFYIRNALAFPLIS